jgi:predicted ATPase/class 3 adenylate cyclase
MRALPSGTVTFLFTDVEGSTRLLQELGDAYADVLSEHRGVLRDAFARHNGVEVDTQGDAFFVAFARASDALAAARDSTKALDGPVRVRVGVHTGEPLVTEEGYVGIDVHRAARIAAAGHGGQVLVSQSTRDLVGGDGLRDLGEHRLKDLTAPERIYQLGDEEFPPLKSLNATNLPVAASVLIGRRSELEQLLDLVHGESRVVTITGAGGSGKTRLSLQVAAELVGEFEDGVFFVPLSPLRDAELVLPTIVQTLGLRDIGELANRDTLLLLDNFEQLLSAARDVAELLANTPRLKLLVTSRAPLRIDGEREYALDPFVEDEAVEFFRERARAVRADVSLNGAVAEICRRLDHLPLALELAAARVKLLDPALLLERLERRLPLLTAGRRDVPERHRTLRLTIEWSYDLLDDRQKNLFAQIAVFAGTFSLEAVEEVCDVELEQLAALVDLSLLKATGAGRFLMLETIREYALERLEQLSEPEELRRRHAETYLAFAETVGGLHVFEGSQPRRIERLAEENDNFRAAIGWALEHRNGDLVLRFASALWFFWSTRGHTTEAGPWVEAALAHSAPQLPERVWGLLVLSELAGREQDFDRVRELTEEALAGFRARSDVWGTAALLDDLGSLAIQRGDHALARELLAEGLELRGRPEARSGLWHTLWYLGELALIENDLEQAESLFRQAYADISEQDPAALHTAACAESVAESLRRRGATEEAGRFFRQTMLISQELGDIHGVAESLDGLAAVAASRGEQDRAGRLVGAAESLRDEWHTDPGRPERIPRDIPEAAKAEGSAMTLDEAVAYALAGVD